MSKIQKWLMCMMAACAAIMALVVVMAWPAFEQLSTSQALHPMEGIGGPFALVNDKGQDVTEASLKGKPSLIFFGFTHCPDVCPTTLFEMSERITALGPDADKLNYVFVSVDPARDTPEQLALYLQSFDPRIRGFSGSEAAIESIVKAYKVYAKRIPLEGGGYNMDHTASIYGADAKGNVQLLIDYDESREMAIAKMKRLLTLPR